MKKSKTTTPTGNDLAALSQDLAHLLQAGKVAINVVHLIWIGDRLMPPDPGDRLAREIQDRLSHSPGRSEPPAARPSHRCPRPPAREGVFRYDGGGTWEIGLGQRICLYRDALGLHQARLLLEHPGQRVPVLELAELCGRAVVIEQRCSEEVADPIALGQIRAQIEKLEDQLMIARETGNPERLGALETELRALEHHYACARSLGGASRQLGDHLNRLRDRVGYTLRSSIRKIVARSPDLGEYLTASLKLGYDCGYFPVTPVRWTL